MGVVIRALSSDETHADVRETESNGDFSVAYDFGTSAPIIVITAQGHNPGATSRILGATLDQVPITLNQLQKDLGISGDSRIVSLDLTREESPTRVYRTGLGPVSQRGWDQRQFSSSASRDSTASFCAGPGCVASPSMRRWRTRRRRTREAGGPGCVASPSMRRCRAGRPQLGRHPLRTTSGNPSASRRSSPRSARHQPEDIAPSGAVVDDPSGPTRGLVLSYRSPSAAGKLIPANS